MSRRILLLGGIGEAVTLARRLANIHAVTYSLAGRGDTEPAVPCAVRIGGFGGVNGLATFLRAGKFDCLVDATHPYAAQISRHAVQAARQVQVPIWAYRRPGWRPDVGDDWRMVADWQALMAALTGFRRPFFTMGQEPLAHVPSIPPGQRWLVRCLNAACQPAANLTLLCERGPFRLDDELALLRQERIDVLVSKNSGGKATKLKAAQALKIPVVMLERPALPAVARVFEDVAVLAVELGC